MDLEAMMLGLAPIITSQFRDTCDLEQPVYSNVDGQIIESSTTTYPDIPCTFEAAYLKPFFAELPLVENMSAQQRFKFLFEKNAQTETITAKTRIRVHARENVPELLFDQPQRLEESLSPLISVEAILRNQ